MDFAGLGIQPLAAPASYAPYVVYGWMALGVAVLIYFLATDRDRIAATRLVFTEGEEPAQAVKRGRPRESPAPRPARPREA